MDLKRFFTDTIEDGYAYLVGGEYIHAVTVCRLKPGYKIIVCNNSGLDYFCTIEEIIRTPQTEKFPSNKTGYVKAKINKTVSNDTETKHFFTLYIGNNKHIDEVVQKAVELGVSSIVPFISQHCNVPTINKKRLETIALESAKQCQRAVLCTIEDPISFDQIGKDDEEVYAFYEFERNNKVSDQPLTDKNIGIVIGCEGGFSENEYKAMIEKGFHVLTLGKSILRVSTAVVSAITLLKERMGEL